jgi:hypothetical protein
MGFVSSDGGAGAQDFAAGLRELEGGVFARGHGDIAEAHQLAGDAGPAGAVEFAADPVGVRRSWPQRRIFSVSAPVEHLDDVVHADAEAAVLGDAVDAGEKFLRQDGAVVGSRGSRQLSQAPQLSEREFSPKYASSSARRQAALSA